MIRFSAALVVAAVVVLIGGIVTSALALVYVAIALSAAALVMLAIGLVLKKDEILGDSGQQVRGATGAAAGQSAPVGQDYGVRQPFGEPPFGQQGYSQSGSGQVGYGESGYGEPARGPNAPYGQDRPRLGRPSTPAYGGASWQAPPPPPPPPPAAQTRVDLTAIGTERSAGRPEPSSQPAPANRAGTGQTAGTGQARVNLSETRLDLTRTDMKPVPAGQDPMPAPPPLAGAVPEAPPPGPQPTSVDLPALRDGTLPAPGSAGGAPAADAGMRTDQPGGAALDDELRTAALPPPHPAEAQAAPAPGQRMVTVVPGVPRYHAGNCILIRFMSEEDLQRMTLEEATAAGCSACRACQADSGAFKATD